MRVRYRSVDGKLPHHDGGVGEAYPRYRTSDEGYQVDPGLYIFYPEGVGLGYLVGEEELVEVDS